MSRTTTCLALALLAILAAGCALPNSIGSYLDNRRNDLIDAAHVDFSSLNAGAVAYAGPFLFGFDYLSGLRAGGAASTLQIGLGGPRFLDRKGLAAGILLPAVRWNEQNAVIGPRPKQAPSGMSAGASAGLIVGLGAEVDLLELIDFAVGLVCLDPGNDDQNVQRPDLEKLVPPPPTPAQAVQLVLKHYGY